MADNQALLVIDMQNGLLKRNVFNKRILIDNVNTLLAHFHKRKEPVFLVRHTNDSFSRENSDDWHIHNELSLSEDDIVINKKHGSVFREKHFLSSLKQKSITRVVITGLVSNGCVQAACRDAKKLGYSVILVSDGHSTFHKDGEAIIRQWNTCLQSEGIQLVSTADFLDMFSLPVKI